MSTRSNTLPPGLRTIVLGLETSCDETGVALYAGGRGLLAHRVYSQTEIHAEYGGVVPELASRDHIRKLVPLLRETFDAAGLELKALSALAYTAGPGLVGALLVGGGFAEGLAFALGVPAVPVHHLEAHLLAPLLEPEPPGFPFLALLVSGGHTMLVEVGGIGAYRILGESLDDAAGEAFDKTAKLLGLGYPGGPAIERLALRGRPGRFRFPRPMVDRPGLDFSFSGLKTYALTTVRAHSGDPDAPADIALAFTEAVVDTFVIKCRRALKATGLKTLVVAGGVSANKALRGGLTALGAELGARVCYPAFEFCTDNGAMIAYAGFLRLAAARRSDGAFEVRTRWPLAALSAPSAG